MSRLITKHLVLRDKFALAVVKTAANPHEDLTVVTGSYVALRKALKELGGGINTLNKMCKAKSEGGLGRLEVNKVEDTWRFTPGGVVEYTDHVAWARRHLGDFAGN